MSMRYSEALPRMEAGEVLEGSDGYAYRVKGGMLEHNDPQFADDEDNWETSDLPYNKLKKMDFIEPRPISNKARELAEEVDLEDDSLTQIPCAACMTVRKYCMKRDMDCLSQNTAYGMQVMLNWLAGHGVKEGA